MKKGPILRYYPIPPAPPDVLRDPYDVASGLSSIGLDYPQIAAVAGLLDLDRSGLLAIATRISADGFISLKDLKAVVRTNSPNWE